MHFAPLSPVTLALLSEPPVALCALTLAPCLRSAVGACGHRPSSLVLRYAILIVEMGSPAGLARFSPLLCCIVVMEFVYFWFRLNGPSKSGNWFFGFGLNGPL